MGLRSATVPDAIVADKMEVENLERHSHTECRRRLGCSVRVWRRLCGRSVREGLRGRLSSEVEELLRNRKVR